MKTITIMKRLSILLVAILTSLISYSQTSLTTETLEILEDGSSKKVESETIIGSNIQWRGVTGDPGSDKITHIQVDHWHKGDHVMVGLFMLTSDPVYLDEVIVYNVMNENNNRLQIVMWKDGSLVAYDWDTTVYLFSGSISY